MSKQEQQKYDMRAPPRRRVKGEETEDQPVFLRKAFAMVSSCPPELGGWSEKGDTVIIKDVKKFAEKIIPTAYKHNNFSSFVRQLNFYGFRKIKSESMEHSDWWEFRHPQFLRDQPNLLSEIKRSVHFESTNVHEVTALKSQVTGLNDRIAALHDQIDKLTGMVEDMKVVKDDEQTAAAAGSAAMEVHVQQAVADDGNDATKKRKLAGSRAAVIVKVEPPSVPVADIDTLQSQQHSQQQQDTSPALMRLSSAEMVGHFQASGMAVPSGPELLRQHSDLFGERQQQQQQPPQTWQDDIDSLFLMEDLMDPTSPRSESCNNTNNNTTTTTNNNSTTNNNNTTTNSNNNNNNNNRNNNSNSIDSNNQTTSSGINIFSGVPAPAPALPQACAVESANNANGDLTAVLDSLSPDLKLRFVDKLAEYMGAQLTQNIAQQTHAQLLTQQEQEQEHEQSEATVVPIADDAACKLSSSSFSPSSAMHPPSLSASTSTAVSAHSNNRYNNNNNNDDNSNSSHTTGGGAMAVDEMVANYRLPSGSKAPEIALPLASAAIAALFSSMQRTSVMNVHQQQHQQQHVQVASREHACTG
eukprot:CAMPEP_0174961030 /NCGR_PEP_ID=MMETSP0004_2-20121128/4020_1 /TAXON_ID=420556 /ORGANISM="Ochromonas sp., Strain CCMP1393" /LENGTH=583 /DNA_ID=CAMNT_0016209443 /DNA_START=176 /DNA_END=1927 /DNA_ORIENTATION=+